MCKCDWEKKYRTLALENEEVLHKLGVAMNVVDGIQQAIDNGVHMKSVFKYLAAWWLHDTRYLSGGMEAHPAARQIVVIGKEALPWILERMRTEPYVGWPILLSEITGDNPVPSEFAGRVALMTKFWLTWGEERGIVPRQHETVV